MKKANYKFSYTYNMTCKTELRMWNSAIKLHSKGNVNWVNYPKMSIIVFIQQLDHKTKS